MQNLDLVAEELFNKIRGRFPSVTIGDAEGNVTNEPKQGRYFDFNFVNEGRPVGKVSISLDEKSVAVVYGEDLVATESDIAKKGWYDFLKELRMFARKRTLAFDTRDITKSNLNSRDYKFLAKNRGGDENMNESKMYGTSRVSYQDFDGARLMIKHTEGIDQDAPGGRAKKVGALYIESAEGERFKYPYKHLTGARAMARHVAEGGNAYDDFGKHIVGLSEEMSKLRKFKTYMGRSAVMAESLSEYVDVVKERIATVKKTLESLQRPSYYKETFEAFAPAVMEDVPSDVAENWIDQLTIRQFNEELADVFPYIYKLVSEATKAEEINPDDLDESGLQRYTGIKKYGKKGFEALQKAGREGASEEEKGAIKDKYLKKAKEEIELETAFEATLGQFSDSVCEECGNPSWTTLGMTEEEIEEGERHGNSKIYDKCWKGYRKVPGKKAGEKGSCKKIESEGDLEEAYIKTSKDAIDTLGALRKIGKSIETGDGEYEGNLANMYANDVYDVISWVENNLDTNDPKYTQVLKPVTDLRKKAKGMETNPGSGKDARFGNEIVNTLYPLMQWIEMNGTAEKEGNAYANAVRQAKKDGKKKGDKIQGPDGNEITLEKEGKTPLGEFILSYFDRETGQFPKGETAILTMVEKDYGDEYIEPAKQFIEMINNKVAEMYGYKDAEVVESESEAVEFLKYLKQDPSYFPGADIEKTANGMVKILASNGEEVAQADVKTGDIYLANGDDYNIADEENAEQTLQTMYAEINGKETDMEEAGYDDGGLGVVEKLLQGLTKDFVKGDDSAAQKMVDMLKKYNAPMDKVADMLEQKAEELTKKTFSIFDNPLKKDPAGNAADRMVTLADYIRSKAGQAEEFDRIRELAGLR